MIQFHALNNLAILVSAIILWILGALWFSPALFAKPWMQLLGIKREPGKRDGMLLGMTASFICDVVLSFVLSTIIMWSNSTGFAHGAILGVLDLDCVFRRTESASGYLREKAVQALRDYRRLLVCRPHHRRWTARHLALVR